MPRRFETIQAHGPGGAKLHIAGLGQVARSLEIFREIAPNTSRVAFVLHPETPVNVGFLRAAEAAAPSHGIKIVALGVHTAAEIERGITEARRGPMAALSSRHMLSL